MTINLGQSMSNADRDSIQAKIERAFEKFERGEFFLAEESRADLQKRKAAWWAAQKG